MHTREQSAAWYPARHGILHSILSHTGIIPHTALYPIRHYIPYDMVSHRAWYLSLARHAMPHGTVSRGMVHLQFVAERVDLALTHVPDLHVLAEEAALKPLLRIVQTRRGSL